ncbi:MAG: hypothetical protein NVS2B16_07110 [Chloroflexota bacterium]
MSILQYALRALSRTPRRAAAGIFGIVLAIGLLSSVFLFVSSSARDMTQRTIATVPVDMRAQALTYGLDTQAAGKALLRQKGVLAVQPLTMSHFSGSSATRAGQTTSTASGPILAVNSAYFTTFPAIRIVQGHFGSSGIVVSQDMGSNLGVRIGDTVTLRLPGRGGPYRAHVIGIANMKRADILFAPTDPLLAGAAYNPPANVVIMPLSVFDARLAARLSKAPPPPEPTTTGGPVAPIVQTSILPVDRELHIRIDRAALPGDPTQAQSQTSLLRLALEKLYPGELRVTDNLFAAIETVKNDVLWAQILFVFLAIPGVLLAGYLSRYAAEALVEQQRREFALLRARGASGEQIIQIVAVMSFAIGLIGSILGLVAGVITIMALFGTQLFALSNWRLWGSAFLWCLLAGLVISGLSTFLPVRRTLRQEITGERQVAQRSTGRPLWTRLYLDVAALIAALVVYRVTQANGFHPVLNAEGNPTLSLSFYTLLAPLLFWIGAVLLLVRIAAALLQRYASRLGRLLAVIFGEVGSYAAITTSRRARTMSKAAVIVALALSFGFSISIFSSTYARQQEVDARLTLGGDVKVTPNPGRPQTSAFTSTLNAVPGAANATPFKTTVAYVGTEIQDIFGVNVAGIRRVSTFSDTFFRSHSAKQTLDKLAATPDGILISDEMANLYSIVPGDHVKIGLFNRHTGSYRITRFTVVGVALEFATAPKDAFLVVNLPALIKATADPSVNSFLLQANGDPATVAKRVQAVLGGDRVQTESIASVRSTLASSLTSLNLNGLVRIEYVYSALIASAGLTVFLLALLSDRRREFATMRALGATGRQLTAFVLSEAGLIALSGLIVGALIGSGQAAMLVVILTSIFDPPPDGPIPNYTLLASLIALSLAGMTIAASIGVRRLSMSRVTDALREQ